MPAHCHKQIREIAKALAGEVYERMMGDNQFWEIWKKQNPDVSRNELARRFIERNWPKMIPEARKALAMTLNSPILSEVQKLEIVDILEKDQSLVRGRRMVH